MNLNIQLFVLLFFFSVSSWANTKYDRLFQDYSGQVPGASVMVIRDGEVVYQNSFGFGDLDKKSPITPDSSFRLASVSKQFTAMATMILKDRGQLSFDDRLTSFFPDFPAYGRFITIRHLLNHTSGLRRYERHLPPNQQQPVTDREVLEILMTLNSLEFPSGSQYRYSNSGYALLAMVVEKVSGQSFQAFVKENIFDPLEMNRSVAYVKGQNQIHHRVYGYSKSGSRYILTDQNLFSSVLGDGGIYSSIRDYFKWDQALYTDQLVSRRTRDEAFEPGRLNNGNSIGYGFGWRIGLFKGMKLIHHTGSSIGFKNVVLRLPARRTTVVVFTNRNSPSPKDIAFQILNLAVE